MSIRLLIGDCREKLRELPDASVHCCVTSPPYYGLRDYGTADWQGGDDSCDHKNGTAHQQQGATSVRQGRSNTEAQRNENFRDTCGKCGATRIDRQLGLEPTSDEYVAGMVEVFREVRRVLRDDGTLWLNIGDSYAGGGGFSPDSPSNQAGSKQTTHKGSIRGTIRPGNGIKPKDLIGIPWMLAFALRADGWYLRQEIIWAKPNPMPESVRDRCTKAHEQIFLLSKSSRYYFDAEAIAEPGADILPNGRPAPRARYGGLLPSEAKGGMHRSDASATQTGVPRVVEAHIRNKRSVWTVATQPFSEAHFATYPPALIEPCILAGCPVGGTVLDPFAGAGTTGLVADRLNRNAILIELNPKYAALAERRMTDDAPLFAEVRAA